MLFDVVAPFKYVKSAEELTEEIGMRIQKLDDHLHSVIHVDRVYVEKEEQKS